MIETIHTQDGETIRTMTPVEYQKLHAETERTERRTEDLLGFACYLRAHTQDRTLAEVEGQEMADLIHRYMATAPAASSPAV